MRLAQKDGFQPVPLQLVLDEHFLFIQSDSILFFYLAFLHCS